jgi:hypothetical protein
MGTGLEVLLSNNFHETGVIIDSSSFSDCVSLYNALTLVCNAIRHLNAT